MNYTYFTKDTELGKKAVEAFCGYLDRVSHKWRPSTKEEEVRGIDVIATALNATYEVKHQTYSGKIVIEEEDGLRGDRGGWIYTSEADKLVEISNDFKRITAFKMSELREIYNKIKHNYRLCHNDVTDGVRGDTWQGSFRVIPIKDIEPYLAVIRVRM